MNTGRLVNLFFPSSQIPSKPTNNPQPAQVRASTVATLPPSSPPSDHLLLYVHNSYLSLPATSSFRSPAPSSALCCCNLYTHKSQTQFRDCPLTRYLDLRFRRSLVVLTAKFINFAWHLFASIHSLLLRLITTTAGQNLRLSIFHPRIVSNPTDNTVIKVRNAGLIGSLAGLRSWKGGYRLQQTL